MNLIDLEEIRKKAAKSTCIGLIFIGIAALCFFLSEIEYCSVIFIVIAVIGFIVGAIIAGKANADFKVVRDNFKSQYLKPIIENIYPNSQFRPDMGVSQSYSTSSRIVPNGDRYSSEDLIKGEYDDVKFTTADVKVEERHVTTSNGQTRVYYETIFQGRFFEFAFNKNFKSDLIVSEKSSRIDRSMMHKVKMESIEFNKKFNTFAQEDHEAFYILTPGIMERMMKLESEHPGNCSFSFVNNKFYFSINNGIDTFELSIFKKIDETILVGFKKEAIMMKEIIELLKLNINIFK